jgi:hypothetical protein
MYYSPQQYKCVKCTFEFMYSPSNSHSGPVMSKEEETDRGTVTHSMPVCPKCWVDFLLKNVGYGLCTVDWGQGSSYDNATKEKTSG